MYIKLRKVFVHTLLNHPVKGIIKLGNPNTCAEVKLCLFLFTLTLEIACHETKVLKTVSSG